MGNAGSLEEESHADGLLEYPVFASRPPGAATGCPRCSSPATTRGSPTGGTTSPSPSPPSAAQTSPTSPGRWRTSAPSRRRSRWPLRPTQPSWFTLQRACWVQEQQANPETRIPPLHEDLADVEAWLGEWTTLVLRSGGSGRRRPRPPGRRGVAHLAGQAAADGTDQPPAAAQHERRPLPSHASRRRGPRGAAGCGSPGWPAAPAPSRRAGG